MRKYTSAIALLLHVGDPEPFELYPAEVTARYQAAVEAIGNDNEVNSIVLRRQADAAAWLERLEALRAAHCRSFAGCVQSQCWKIVPGEEAVWEKGVRVSWADLDERAKELTAASVKEHMTEQVRKAVGPWCWLAVKKELDGLGDEVATYKVVPYGQAVDLGVAGWEIHLVPDCRS